MSELYDVAVIGAGVAGVAAAARLAGDGHAVLLVASHERHPREFRAEKFGVFEAEQLAALGLWDVSRASVTHFDEVLLGRWGVPAGRVGMREYSMRYPDFVDALGAGLPPRVRRRTGRVARIEPAGPGGPEQGVVMADGHVARARLVVLATGLMDGLRRDLGLGRTVVSKAHSLVYGFDLAASAGLRFQSLTWQGERFGDGIAYLTLFPLGGTLRANLFTHWDPAGEDAAAFAADPAGALAARLPGFTRLYGRVAIIGPVERRAVDVSVTPTPRRDGVVLIGDAYRTSCPSTGTGIRKVLTDVDRLAAHARRWLAAPGASVAAAEIAAFYADPVKAACDERSLALSLDGRRMLTDRSLAWRFRRIRSLVYRRGRHGLDRLRAATIPHGAATADEAPGGR